MTLPINVTCCQSLFLANEDRASLRGYVVYVLDNGRTMNIGRVEEILANTDTGVVLGLLVSKCIIGPAVLPYRMPSCQVAEDEKQFVTFEVSTHFF